MDIGIVGLGLIGGSLALDLKKRGVAFNVYGLDRSLEHQKQAKGGNYTYSELLEYMVDIHLLFPFQIHKIPNI